MSEIVWRYDPAAVETSQPANAAEARQRLERGNAAFAGFGGSGRRHVISVGPDAIGLPRDPEGGLPQEPFAAVLGCADARVPVEMVFGQAANDLFVVRVAGNVPGTTCVGSLHYATAHIPSVRLVVVVGHTGCGAVSAAVDALLAPEHYLEIVHDAKLRSIVDSLLAGVRMASLALAAVHGSAVTSKEGFRQALTEVAIVANVAITATVLCRDVEHEVAFGVFDLARRTVGVATASGWTPGLAAPPADDVALTMLLADAAANVELG